MKVTVLYNLPGTSSTTEIAEADNDTQISAIGIFEELKKLGYSAEILGISQNEIKNLKNLKTDLVFNLVEWSGRESKDGIKVLKTLENAKIKYTGSSAWGYELSCNKFLMKQKMIDENISTPKWQIFKTGKEKITLPYPIIVKPSSEHCAIGVSQTSVCDDEKSVRVKILELIHLYKQPVLGEEFIEGLEAHVTVLQKNGRAWVLPPAVIKFLNHQGFHHILTYESKWQNDNWESKFAKWDELKLSDNILRKIEKLAKKTNDKLGGRSYARIDMRIRDDEVFVLEINNNPGIDFDPDSGIAYSAKKAGLTWDSLLKNIVEETG